MDADADEGRGRLERFVRENWPALAVTYTEVPRFGRLIESYEPEKAIVVAVTGAGQGPHSADPEPTAAPKTRRSRSSAPIPRFACGRSLSSRRLRKRWPASTAH